MKRTAAFGVTLLLALLMACSGGEESGKKETLREGKDRELPNRPQAYLLPTPLQVATFLHMYNIEFQDRLLRGQRKEYSTAHEQTLNLGVEIVDLGYATLFDQQHYIERDIKRVRDMMDELNIETVVKDSVFRRFDQHLGNKEALSRIIQVKQRIAFR